MLEFAKLHPILVGMTCFEGIFPHTALFAALIWHVTRSKRVKNQGRMI
jgi:hypothetical protein